MSLFGFELFDSIPISRFTSQSDGTSETENLQSDSGSESDLPSLPTHHSAEDVIAFPNTANPPEWIDVEHDSELWPDDGDSASSNAAGITILSSVPSSNVSLTCSDQPAVGTVGVSSVEMMMMMEPSVLIENASIVSSVDSVQNRSSAEHQSGLSASVSDLSLNSQLLSSSIEDLSIGGSRSRGRSDGIPEAVNETNICEEDATSFTCIDAAAVNNNQLVIGTTTEREKNLWYTHLTSEEDWDKFQKNAMEILAALDSEDFVADDRTLAKLIQQEEAMFWSSNETDRLRQVRKRYLQRGLVLLGNTVMLLSAPGVASVAAYWVTHRSQRR